MVDGGLGERSGGGLQFFHMALADDVYTIIGVVPAINCAKFAKEVHG
jgi:hypothetical protein